MPTTQGKVEFTQIDATTIPNRRSTYKNIDGLAADIRRVGLLQPPLIWRKKIGDDTKFFLLAGHRRYRAILKIREEDPNALSVIPVTLLDGNEDDALKAQLAENVQREELGPVELADACTDLVNRGHATKDIAECINRSIAWVGKLLKLRQNCSQKVLQALTDGQISISIAFDLMEHEEAKQAALLEACVKAKQLKGTKAAKNISRTESNRPALPGKKALTLLYSTVITFDTENDDFWSGVCEALAFALGKKTGLEQEVANELEERRTQEEEAPVESAEEVTEDTDDDLNEEEDTSEA